MRKVDSAAAVDLVPFVRDSVAAGANVITDGSRAYNMLPDHGYTRTKHVPYGSAYPRHRHPEMVTRHRHAGPRPGPRHRPLNTTAIREQHSQRVATLTGIRLV